MTTLRARLDRLERAAEPDGPLFIHWQLTGMGPLQAAGLRQAAGESREQFLGRVERQRLTGAVWVSEVPGE